MSDSIGHEMLNHLGKRITVTARTLRRLDMQHWLERDKPTGLMRFKGELAHLFYEMGPDYELGPDMSGPNVCKCNCRECIEKLNLDDTRVSDIRTQQIVRDVKSRRKIAA
jgi:hypothetical protein